MPSVATLLVFSVAALGLLVVPGPAVLYITARSAAQGSRAGLVSVIGVHTGTLVHIAAAVAGLSAIVVSSAFAFSTVKLAGAGYLIWLGVRTLMRGRVGEGDAVPGAGAARTLRRVYWDGVVVNALNPKTALFFLAFLPQFVDGSRGPVWAQTLVLGLLFIVLGLLSDSAYALAGAGVGRWLRTRSGAGAGVGAGAGAGAGRRDRGRFLEGGVLVGLGVAALFTPGRAPSGSASS